jgi:Na+/glutamate symporter
MTISTTTKSFIESLIDYYISEASSYKQFAQEYAPEVGDIAAATFGIIVGCVYSGFLQAYANQKQKPSLSDIQEFHQIIKRRAAQIKKGVLDAKV